MSRTTQGIRLLIPLLGLHACSEYELNDKSDVAVSGTEELPVIEVDPLVVNFGSLTPEEGTSEPEVITVRNIGEEDLDIHEVILLDSDAAFNITAVGSTLLRPDDETTFLAVFDPPGEDSYLASVFVSSSDPETPEVEITLLGGGESPDIVVTPEEYDFGTLEVGETDSMTVTISNEGTAALTISDLDYDASTSELSLDPDEATNGALPWILASGESRYVYVDYTPDSSSAIAGTLSVGSDDPDTSEALAIQVGQGKSFEGFSTGWYVFDDGIAYETTSNPSYVIDHHGDVDLYWYEPSGAHGMVDSSDPDTDFATLRGYVIDNAGAPTEVSGPFTYDASSSISTFEYATFTYFLCDFWLDADEDPSSYEISSGTVDDGIQVMVNGEILGQLKLSESGSWGLDNATAGEVNTLVIILVDDSASNKYVNDLAFYKDGVMVEG